MELIDRGVFASQALALGAVFVIAVLVCLPSLVRHGRAAIWSLLILPTALCGALAAASYLLDRALLDEERDWKLQQEGLRTRAVVLSTERLPTRRGADACWKLRCRYTCSDGDVREGWTHVCYSHRQLRPGFQGPAGAIEVAYMASDSAWMSATSVLRETPPDWERTVARWCPWLLVACTAVIGLMLAGSRPARERRKRADG